jgi:hypothetical protein
MPTIEKIEIVRSELTITTHGYRVHLSLRDDGAFLDLHNGTGATVEVKQITTNGVTVEFKK